MSEDYKRLYRSRTDRMISGVCGGIGDYFNVDPTLIRLLFVIFAFAGGPGLLAYIVLAIIVPEEPVGQADYESLAPEPVETAPTPEPAETTPEAPETE